MPASQDVEQDIDRSVHGAPDATGKAHDLSGAIADRANPVQSLLDPRAIIGAERRNPRADVGHVFVTYRSVREIFEVVFEACLGRAPEIEHDFDDVFDVMEADERLPNREWEDVEQLRKFPTWGNFMNSNRQY
jgi:hypothetical protein